MLSLCLGVVNVVVVGGENFWIVSDFMLNKPEGKWEKNGKLNYNRERRTIRRKNFSFKLSCRRTDTRKIETMEE